MEPRTIIITGASRGIGRALAQLCLGNGHRVIAIARNVTSLEELAAKYQALTPIQADLSDPVNLEHLIGDVIAHAGPGPVLVNNAAVQDDWDFCDSRNTKLTICREVTLNLTAPIVLAHALCSADPAARPVIVNIQSLLALAPKRTAAVYSATKAGLRLFSRAMQLQKSGEGIRIVEVYMPLVDTDMTAGRGSGKISPQAAAEQVYRAMTSGSSTIHVGKARLLAAIHALSPRLAGSILARM